MSDVKTNAHPIWAAAKAALPYSAPMLAGFLFLGVAYGIYMKALGFGVWYPVLMALFIYAGSVEFIIAGALRCWKNTENPWVKNAHTLLPRW